MIRNLKNKYFYYLGFFFFQFFLLPNFIFAQNSSLNNFEKLKIDIKNELIDELSTKNKINSLELEAKIVNDLRKILDNKKSLKSELLKDIEDRYYFSQKTVLQIGSLIFLIGALILYFLSKKEISNIYDKYRETIENEREASRKIIENCRQKLVEETNDFQSVLTRNQENAKNQVDDLIQNFEKDIIKYSNEINKNIKRQKIVESSFSELEYLKTLFYQNIKDLKGISSENETDEFIESFNEFSRVKEIKLKYNLAETLDEKRSVFNQIELTFTTLPENLKKFLIEIVRDEKEDTGIRILAENLIKYFESTKQTNDSNNNGD